MAKVRCSDVDIWIDDARYHRNGADEGFHVIRFVWRSRNRTWRPEKMQAVLFDGPGRCAVTCLDNPRAKFRAATFESALRAWLETVEADEMLAAAAREPVA